MKQQPPRMDKQSKLRRLAKAELPVVLATHRRKVRDAINQANAKRPPRAVQIAARRQQREERRKAMAERRREIIERLGPPPVQILEEIPKPQEAAASLTAGDQSDG